MSDTNMQSCTMCFFRSYSKEVLIKHIVRYHRHDPRFKVKCLCSGCGATFNKWKSYRQHIFRKHNTVFVPAVNETEGLDTIIIDSQDNHEEFNRDLPALDPTFNLLQWHVAKFLLKMREECRISQNSIETIIEGTTILIDVFLAMILEECRKLKVPQTELICFDDIKYIVQEKCPPQLLFSATNTKASLDKFLVEKMHMTMPVKRTISKSWQWRKKKTTSGTRRHLREVPHDAYIVPFMDNLKNLLVNEEVRNDIDNPLEHLTGVYRTVLDGSLYKENAFFRENENAIAIILYYDDVGVANPLGSSSKSHKLSMFYWTLANIHPESRSTLNAVQLYAIVKTNHLKEPSGIENVLRPFIDDIKKLQTEGINICVNNNIKNYKGSLLFFAGDTPASAFIGGFKESVSANHPCRTCMIPKRDLAKYFREDEMVLRNIDGHDDQLSAIDEPTISKGAKEFWQKTYGINRRSELMDIPNFDITIGLPQDCMHVLIEGVVEITIRLFLCYCINEKKLFSIDNLNRQINSFNYGHYQKDKPAQFYKNDLAFDKSLRQNAAQIFVLAHTLPFLIGESMLNIEDADFQDQIDCYILMLQIMNLCLAYDIAEESIDILSRVIETFLSRFILLFPGRLVPKFHFMIHIPRYMKLFGPGRQQWCFRFEAAHAYFKSLVPVVRNFKNLPYTLSYRHQARQCSQLATYPGQPTKRILYAGDNITDGPTVLLTNLSYATLFNSYIPENIISTYKVMLSPKVIIHGITYENKSIVLVECEENCMPVFGEISNICVLENNLLAVVTLLVTIGYEYKVNAYEICQSSVKNSKIIQLNNLIFPHPLCEFKVLNQKFVSLINHERCEFVG